MAPGLFKGLNHLLSGSNCLHGEFDFAFYDIESSRLMEVVAETIENLPDCTGKMSKKVAKNGAASISQRLAVPERLRYYNYDISRWETEDYKRIVELKVQITAPQLENNSGVIRIHCHWESNAREFKVSFLDIINQLHDQLYNSLCKFGKVYLVPPTVKVARENKKKIAEEGKVFREFAVSVFAWDFEERINRFICKYADDTTPEKRSALQQYWWNITYDFMQDRRVHLELSPHCPLNKFDARLSVHFEMSSDYTRKYIFSVSASADPLAALIADAAVADLTLLFANHLAYRSGNVQQYVLLDEEHSDSAESLLAQIKEYVFHDTNLRGHAGQRIKWQQDFQDLEKIGELRLFCARGIRLVFRVGEKEWRKQGAMIPVSADWIIFADPVPLELSEIISDTVTSLFIRFSRRKKSTSNVPSWDFWPSAETRRAQDSGRQAKWPTPQEYQEAMQNAHSNLLDLELKEAEVQLSNLGLPQAISGGFASVYKLTSGDREWAVRCFLNPIRDQELRYSQISRFIETDTLSYTVGFEYVPDGILVNGKSFPLVKMPWVKGVPLNTYLNHRYGNAETLAHLRQAFHKMHQDLLKEGMAHCDFQHGNILIHDDELFLVDYDNVFIQPLEGMPSNELGHINYQHPSRSRSDYGLYLDNFSAWVIDSSFACLQASPMLWKQLNGGDECLLFRRNDFIQPDQSALFSFMDQHDDPDLRERAKTLREFLKLSPSEVPPLGEKVSL